MKKKLQNLIKEFQTVEYNIINEDKNLETVNLEVTLMNYKKPKIDNTESTLKLILTQLTSIQTQITTIQNQIVTIQNEIVTIQNEIVTIKSQIATIQNEIVSINSRIDNMEKNFNSRLDKIEADIEILKSFHKEDFAKLKEQQT